MRAVRKTSATLAVACLLALGIAGHAGAAPLDGRDGADDDGAPTTSAPDDVAPADPADPDGTAANRDTDAAPASTSDGDGSRSGIDLDKPVTDAQLRYVTDFLVFRASMGDFQHVRRQRLLSDQVSWQTGACDTALRDSAETGFREACERREFGYRNFAMQERFDDALRERVDRRFKQELREQCAGKDAVTRTVCERKADVYFAAIGTV